MDIIGANGADAPGGDDLVRESHADMDGIVVYSDEQFNTATGPVEQPAGSGSASFDVNCRCNLIPFLDKDRADASSERRKPFREKDPETGERVPRIPGRGK